MNEPEVIRRILKECKTIAVIGLSSDPGRPSNGVAAYMQSSGYRVIPVNPFETEVLGEKAYPHLSDVPADVDLVNIFRRPEKAGEAVDHAIAAGVRAVWMQEGVIDESAAARAEEAGLSVVMGLCWLKEHYRHGR